MSCIVPGQPELPSQVLIQKLWRKGNKEDLGCSSVGRELAYHAPRPGFNSQHSINYIYRPSVAQAYNQSI